ncbi:MAG: hypothetical protein DYG89_22840 [Caldilinea sp. CFX5]|nr:hypothetical protein [Caldilinea sp. CFX5]
MGTTSLKLKVKDCCSSISQQYLKEAINPRILTWKFNIERLCRYYFCSKQPGGEIGDIRFN